MKTNRAILAAALVFVVGGIIYLQSAQRHFNKPFVVMFSHYRERTPEKSETMIQLVNSRGKSLIRRIGPDGRDVQHLVPAYPPGGWADRAAYLRSTHVIRTEQILGLTAYVFREDVGGQVLEEWFAPETGPVPLKTIIETVGADTIIIEAFNIEFREVSDHEVEPQPSLVR